MRDSCGRTIDYLRLSVTDLCNYRCQYCMPPEGVEKRLHSDILSTMLSICSSFCNAFIYAISLLY